MQIKGSIFYVTGCNSGIGLALAERLLEKGAKLCGVDLRTTELAELGHKYGGNLTTYTASVTDWKNYTASFVHAVKVFGRIDGVFLNAGVYDAPGGYWQNAEQSITLTMDVNVSAVMAGARVAIDRFLLQKSPGLIVVTGSVAAQTTSVKVPVYVASKWAVEGFVRSLAPLEEQLGIRVVVFEPGPVKTALWRQIGVHEDALPDSICVTVPKAVDAIEDIILNTDGFINGGTAYEVAHDGTRVYTMESPRHGNSSAKDSDALDMANNARSALATRQEKGLAV
ncbi:NAD(P)-binding protein [Calocera viscosa TUFC12733]|uniref:NAD(P)-binding protein n=1 Tax=Calocera viscosa (strain TUFC12733) TaxID=1330018 RepID=A0A167FIL6_CALVF|nr:NAD(P)-binding protein [Calocera viscosa TUFC12733]KZO89566.1 NAD(P)-binding protein [Calocera viscosa TUFC12733]